MATMKELLSLMIERINGKPGNWEELTGKPFGLTMGWEILVEQPDIIGSGYSQEPYSALVALTDVALEQGKIYKVAINGDEWEVKAFVLPEDTNVYLGDASDRLEEMPFHIYSTEDKTICIIWQITPEEYEMGAPMANITISKGYEAVDTLGYEFMPLDYPAVLKEYVEIMPKAVIKFEETGLNGSVYSNSTIINEGLLSEDKAYRITFNGEKYICQSQVWRGSAFLGNMEILTGTDGNDLPFAILGNMLNWKVELGEEVNLQIEEINNIIRPIDKKFIPDGVGGGVKSVNNIMPDENGNIEIVLPELTVPELKWDEIQDKPFGITYAGENIIVAQPAMAARVGEGLYRLFPTVQAPIMEGIKYNLYFNNKNYIIEFQADTSSVTSAEGLIAGSLDIPTADSELPFHLVFVEGQTYLTMAWPEAVGRNFTFFMNSLDIVDKIDLKYMPEGYPAIETNVSVIMPAQEVAFEPAGDYYAADLTPMPKYWVTEEGWGCITKCGNTTSVGALWHCPELDVLCAGNGKYIGFEDLGSKSSKWVVVIYKDGRIRMIGEQSEPTIVELSLEVQAPIPLDDKFLPVDISREGHQHNWDDIKDPPFGVSGELIEVFPQQTVTAVRPGSAMRGVVNIPIKVDTKYIFKINDKTYELTSYINENGVIAIGESSLPNDKNIPFVYIPSGDNFSWLQSLGNPIILTVYEDTREITPIDYKFMPEGYPKAEVQLVEIVPEQSVTGIEVAHENKIMPDYDIPTNLSQDEMLNTRKLKIVFNGVAYECDANPDIINEDEFSFGATTKNDDNGEAVWDWSKYPFYVAPSFNEEDENAYYSVMWNATFGEIITLAIYEEQEVVIPLDSKFLPETVALKEYVDEAVANGNGVGAKGTGSGAVVFGHTDNIASGWLSAAFGERTQATGDLSYAGGYESEATGGGSHAEGQMNIASGLYSYAYGSLTQASGTYSFAEGREAKAVGQASHAEGNKTQANGWYSHAEGTNTQAVGQASHAEGTNTQALGTNSHASGEGTIANTSNEFVIGAYNIPSTLTIAAGVEGYKTIRGGSAYTYRIPIEPSINTETGSFNITEYEKIVHTSIRVGDLLISNPTTEISEYDVVTSITSSSSNMTRYNCITMSIIGEDMFVIGNGSSDTKRSNAHTLDWSGNAWYAGKILVGGTGRNDENASEVATKAYVEELIGGIENGTY